MDELLRLPVRRAGLLGIGLLLAWLTGEAPARAQQQGASKAASATGPSAADAGSQENLTVLGHRKRFEAAPMPGPELPPPPDKPGLHLGRYKISGDQSKKDSFDDQTGAFIAPFGSAYTGASPVAGGLASQHQQ